MDVTRQLTEGTAPAVEAFVREVGRVSDDDPDFTREVNLFNAGYLDSLGVVSLITFIAEEFGVELSDDDLLDPAFTSVDGISAIVGAALRRQEGTGAAWT